MTPILVHHTEPGYGAVCAFVSTRIWGREKPFSVGTAMAVVHGASMVAGVVFHDYDPDAGIIQVSGASDDRRWMTRPVLWAIYNYAFNVLGCQAVIQRNDPDNEYLARMMPRYGFDRYDIPRLRGRNKGEAIFVLTDDAWRKNGFHKEHA